MKNGEEKENIIKYIKLVVVILGSFAIYLSSCDSTVKSEKRPITSSSADEQSTVVSQKKGSIRFTLADMDSIEGITKVSLIITALDGNDSHNRNISEDFVKGKTFTVADLAVKTYKIEMQLHDKDGNILAKGEANNVVITANDMTSVKITLIKVDETGSLAIEPVIDNENGDQDPADSLDAQLQYFEDPCGWWCPTFCFDPGVTKVVHPECEPGNPCTKDGETCLYIESESGHPGYVTCRKEQVKDPICPISKRAAKDQIKYLSREDQNKIVDEILNLKVTTYRYKSDFGDPKEPQMGFIIDDVPNASFLAKDRRHVNLYAYISAAVLTIQQQQAAIDELKRKIVQLESKKKVTPID